MENENSLQKFCFDWDKSMLTNDVNEISRFMSEDWTILGTEGGITSKSTFLSWISSGDLTHSRMDSDEMHVKIYGETGVVISRGTSEGLYKGESFSFYEWSTSVFVWKNSKWNCVSTMLTPAKHS